MLTRTTHAVREVEAGAAGYRDGLLSLDLDSLAALVTSDPRLVAAHLAIVQPGERTRVLNVLDVFDARQKEEGPTYPGFDGPPVAAGTGRTHVLDGFQIVASGLLPTGEGGLMVARQAFIDYWGEGARWSLFAATPTLAVDLRLDAAIQDKAVADDAVRRALIRVSTAIGALAVDAADGADEQVPTAWERPPAADGGPPRVAYVYQIQSQGALLETFLYGADIAFMYPTLIEAAELLDGAMVSGNHGLQTNPTVHHTSNPVLRRLLAEERAGRLTLLPVVLMEGHHKSTPAKQRSAAHAVQLLRTLRAEGAVFTQEGGGMSIVDQMLAIEGATAAGIRCVGVTYEMAGEQGADTPLIYYSSAARHLVSTGNREERVSVEAAARVVGLDTGESTFGADLSGPLTVPLYALYCSTSQVGGTRVRAVAV
ncbi:MAG TPA: glycine/sarcosine/betaine reductase component B subunit [Chloroflexota bacterium]|jgi:glycine reductase